MEANVVIRSVFLGLFAAASFGFGEAPQPLTKVHNDSAPTNTPKPKRPEGIWDIDKYAELLSGLFVRPVGTLKRQYEQPLPAALENVVKRKDEGAISGILAELFHTANDKQWKQIRDVARAERKIKEQADKTDAEAIALLERLEWAASGLLDINSLEKSEKAEAFNKAFFGNPPKLTEDGKLESGAYSDRGKLNEDIFANIKKANSPDSTEKDRTDAKKFLRENLTRDAIMAFVEGQMRTGNTQSALDLMEAVAWKDPSGQRFMEMFQGGTAQRLYMGPTRESMQAALETYAKNKGGLHTAALAQKEHERVVPKEFMVQGTQLVSNRPKGVKPPKALAQTSTSNNQGVLGKARVAAPRQAAPVRPVVTGGALPNSGPPRLASRPSNNQGSSSATGGAALFSQNCTAACHSGPWPKSKDAMIQSIRSGSMPKPPGKKLSEAEKSALIAYLGG